MDTDFLAPWFDLATLEADESTVVAIDRDCAIRWANPAWHRFALANGGPEVARRYGPGASYLDGIAPPLRSFYEAAFTAARAKKEVFALTYECSSPDVFRLFRLRALPFEGDGLLLEHSKVVEHPHDRIPSELPPASYARPDGTILQCSNCRRVRRASADTWDWVPAWAKAAPRYTSHGLCGACLAFYWGVK